MVKDHGTMCGAHVSCSSMGVGPNSLCAFSVSEARSKAACGPEFGRDWVADAWTVDVLGGGSGGVCCLSLLSGR